MNPTGNKSIAIRPNHSSEGSQQAASSGSTLSETKKRIAARARRQKSRANSKESLKRIKDFYIAKKGSLPEIHSISITTEEILEVLNNNYSEHPIYKACSSKLEALAQYIRSPSKIVARNECTPEFQLLLNSGPGLTKDDFYAAKNLRKMVSNRVSASNSHSKDKLEHSFFQEFHDNWHQKHSQRPEASDEPAISQDQQPLSPYAEGETDLSIQTSRKRKNPEKVMPSQEEGTKKLKTD